MGKKELTDEYVAMIAGVAAEKAVEVYRKMENTERKRRERTESKPAKTKKLLTAYRRMKTDIADTEELTEEEKREFRWRFIEDLMGSAGSSCDRTEKDIEKYEIKRKKNLFYVQIIDRAMKLYRQECESSPYEEDIRRYREVHGDLVAFASASLTGGTEDNSKVNASVATFLDAAEKIKFNYMAFPTSEASLITAAVTKIKYIRNSIGWKCGLVVADSASDYEDIYNLTNSFEYEGMKLTTAQATAWLAGAAAAAGYTTSLTYATVAGATGVVGDKTNEEAIQAIKKGETFFTINESGDVILEYDVNSKVTFTQDDPADILKGRPCRVYDSFANDLLLTFVPGRFNNDSTGWTVMEGLGRSLLIAYQNDGAIQNVDEENDFPFMLLEGSLMNHI